MFFNVNIGLNPPPSNICQYPLPTPNLKFLEITLLIDYD